MITLIQVVVFGSLALVDSTSMKSFTLSDLVTCGIIIKDFNKMSNQQRDTRHSIVKMFNSNKAVLQVVTIQNQFMTWKNSTSIIFRSARHNCFVHFHIQFNGNLFNSLHTTNSSDNEYEITLRKTGIFFIVKRENLYTLYTSQDWYYEMRTPHKIFLLRLYSQNIYKGTPLSYYEVYYWCTFCKNPIVLVGQRENLLEIKLTNFRGLWLYSTHYWPYPHDLKRKKKFILLCYNPNLRRLYALTKLCDTQQATYELIARFSSTKISIIRREQPHLDLSNITYIFPASRPLLLLRVVSLFGTIF